MHIIISIIIVYIHEIKLLIPVLDITIIIKIIKSSIYTNTRIIAIYTKVYYSHAFNWSHYPHSPALTIENEV